MGDAVMAEMMFVAVKWGRLSRTQQPSALSMPNAIDKPYVEEWMGGRLPTQPTLVVFGFLWYLTLPDPRQ